MNNYKIYQNIRKIDKLFTDSPCSSGVASWSWEHLTRWASRAHEQRVVLHKMQHEARAQLQQTPSAQSTLTSVKFRAGQKDQKEQNNYKILQGSYDSYIFLWYSAWQVGLVRSICLQLRCHFTTRQSKHVVRRLEYGRIRSFQDPRPARSGFSSLSLAVGMWIRLNQCMNLIRINSHPNHLNDAQRIQKSSSGIRFLHPQNHHPSIASSLHVAFKSDDVILLGKGLSQRRQQLRGLLRSDRSGVMIGEDLSNHSTTAAATHRIVSKQMTVGNKRDTMMIQFKCTEMYGDTYRPV